jgi:hypothetical protein
MTLTTPPQVSSSSIRSCLSRLSSTRSSPFFSRLKDFNNYNYKGSPKILKGIQKTPALQILRRKFSLPKPAPPTAAITNTRPFSAFWNGNQRQGFPPFGGFWAQLQKSREVCPTILKRSLSTSSLPSFALSRPSPSSLPSSISTPFLKVPTEALESFQSDTRGRTGTLGSGGMDRNLLFRYANMRLRPLRKKFLELLKEHEEHVVHPLWEGFKSTNLAGQFSNRTNELFKRLPYLFRRTTFWRRRQQQQQQPQPQPQPQQPQQSEDPRHQ